MRLAFVTFTIVGGIAAGAGISRLVGAASVDPVVARWNFASASPLDATQEQELLEKLQRELALAESRRDEFRQGQLAEAGILAPAFGFRTEMAPLLLSAQKNWIADDDYRVISGDESVMADLHYGFVGEDSIFMAGPSSSKYRLIFRFKQEQDPQLFAATIDLIAAFTPRVRAEILRRAKVSRLRNW